MAFSRILNLDFETYSATDLLKHGMYRYMEDPQFEIMLCSYSFDGGPVKNVDLMQKRHLPPRQRIPAELLQALEDPTCLKRAQNAPFEMNGSRVFFGIEIDPRCWKCTMIQAGSCGLPFALEAAGRILKINEQKDGNGYALIKYFCMPCVPTIVNGGRTRNLPEHDKSKWDQFKRYCDQDVRSEISVAKEVDFLIQPDFEHELWCLDYVINSTGIKVDLNLIHNALKLNFDFRERLTKELFNTTGITKPNAVKQIIKWLEEEEDIEGEIVSLKKDNIPAVLRKLTSDKSKRVLEIRQQMSKTSVKKYSTMLAYVCKDGRIRGLFQFLGANRTGRWAGRGLQFHNLPKSKLSDYLLNAAREMVLNADGELLECIFGAIPDTLSQLIRTAFIAEEGYEFPVSDFKSIEARVISWLANETWRLDVFAGDGKIYEATGARMFSIPIEEVTKGSTYRDAAKVGELACGFNGGIDALVRMCLTYKIEIPDDLMKPFDKNGHDTNLIVENWRTANPKIVKLWKAMQKAAIMCIQNGTRIMLTDIRNYDGSVMVDTERGLYFEYVKGHMLIRLPSGRRLCYWNASLEDGKYGKEVIYYGLNQVTKQWCKQRTYGGKLTENCWAAGTKILTNNGWLSIETITDKHLIWDGFEWVSNQGAIDNGIQETINLNGLGVTPDHKILTDHGWKNASSCDRYNRTTVQLPDGSKFLGLRWQKIFMECKMHLRQVGNSIGLRVKKIADKILRMPIEIWNRRKEYETWNDQPSGILGLAINDRSMSASNASSLRKLWSTWNIRLRKMENISWILGGYGGRLQTSVNTGSDKCEWKLREIELSVGDLYYSGEQSAEKYVHQYPERPNDSCIGIGPIRDKENNALLSDKTGGIGTFSIRQTGLYQNVYDIVNCGPRHQYVVMDGFGIPFIAHNCVQAIARDCLASGLINLHRAGIRIPAHVHDESVPEVKKGSITLERVNELMCKKVRWMKDLPLEADGFKSDYYRKEA